MKERLLNGGNDTMDMSPQEFAKLVRSEMDDYSPGAEGRRRQAAVANKASTWQVPYKGTPEAIDDTIAGTHLLLLGAAQRGAAARQGGKPWRSRSPAKRTPLPDVPTSRSGRQGPTHAVVAVGTGGCAEIVNKMNAARARRSRSGEGRPGRAT